MRLKNYLLVFSVLAMFILNSIPMGESEEESEINVEVMIDFGNGMVEWAHVSLDTNRTAIKATEEACTQLDIEVDVSWSQWGAFVNSINGMSSPDWRWWWKFILWNGTIKAWEASSVGAGEIELENGDTIGWIPSWSWSTPHPNSLPTMKYPWPMFQHDAENLRAIKGKGPSTNSVQWLYNIGTIELACSPVIARGKVVLNNWDGVFCLDEDGALLWKNNDVQAIYTPAIDGIRVFVGGKDGFLYALNMSNGNILWEMMIASHPGVSGVASPPKVVRGRVFVGSFNFSGGEGFLYCLDEESGAVIWKNTTYSSVYFSSPCVSQGRVYVGTMGRYNSSTLKWNAPYDMLCYGADTGAPLWNFSVEGSVGSSPTIVNEKLLFTSKDGNLYCLDAENGELIWQRNIGDSISSPAVSDGFIYVGSGEMNREGLFFCFDMDGNKIWELQPNGAVQSSPAVAADHVYFATNVQNGTIYCLNKDNGQMVWDYKPWPEQYIISSPAIVNGKLFICSDNGRLYCFGGETPKITVDVSGATGTVNLGEDIKFVHNNEENTMVITRINSTAVTLRIDSTLQTINLNLGETKKLDTDEDGKNDISMTLNELNTTSQTASLTLKALEETKGKGINPNLSYALVIIFVVIVVVALLIIAKRH